MKKISSITSRARQTMTLVLDNNETVDFNIYYSPRMQSWFFDFTYKELTANCSKVVITPNALRQFKKIIPFGIMFTSESLIDPYQVTDFSTGNVSMYLLNKEEVQQIESEIFNA